MPGRVDSLNTQIIARAALEGNRIALEAFDRACQAYGWGLAQVITLLAPDVIVVGGGVSLVGEDLWFAPLAACALAMSFPRWKTRSR